MAADTATDAGGEVERAKFIRGLNKAAREASNLHERNDSVEQGRRAKAKQADGGDNCFWNATSGGKGQGITADVCAGAEHDRERGGIGDGQSARDFADGLGLLLKVVRRRADHRSVVEGSQNPYYRCLNI
jgi:hypothetical protein